MSKHETLKILGGLLSELFEARDKGADSARVYRAQGLADGYMRALTDLAVINDTEMLKFVNEERRRVEQLIDSEFNSGPQARTAPYFA
jgi:hypothetical protein